MTDPEIIDLPNFLPYRLAVATDAVLTLSDSGAAIYRRIVPMARAYEHDLFARLTPAEADILMQALARLSQP